MFFTQSEIENLIGILMDTGEYYSSSYFTEKVIKEKNENLQRGLESLQRILRTMDGEKFEKVEGEEVGDFEIVIVEE